VRQPAGCVPSCRYKLLRELSNFSHSLSHKLYWVNMVNIVCLLFDVQ